MTPKQKALELIKEYDMLIGKGIGIIAAGKSVQALIEEHTFSNPIGWNRERKKYWESVYEELEKY